MAIKKSTTPTNGKTTKKSTTTKTTKDKATKTASKSSSSAKSTKSEGSTKKQAGETKRKQYAMPGQKKDAPDELVAIRLFYESTYRENPYSEMAAKWLLTHGLLPLKQAEEFHKKGFGDLQKKHMALLKKQKTSALPSTTKTYAEAAMEIDITQESKISKKTKSATKSTSQPTIQPSKRTATGISTTSTATTTGTKTTDETTTEIVAMSDVVAPPQPQKKQKIICLDSSDSE